MMRRNESTPLRLASRHCWSEFGLRSKRSRFVAGVGDRGDWFSLTGSSVGQAGIRSFS
jgi:hypothetical protein